MLETSPEKVADGVEILTFNIFENDTPFYFERVFFNYFFSVISHVHSKK